MNRTMPDVLAPFHSYIPIHAPVQPSRAFTGPFAPLKMHPIAYVAARDGTYAFIAHGRSPTDEFWERQSPRWLYLRISERTRDRAATCLAGPSRWRSRSIASIAAQLLRGAAKTVAWPLSPQGDGGRVTAWRLAIRGAELDSIPPLTHPPPSSPPSPPFVPLLPRAP